jgi:hypothetical protein
MKKPVQVFATMALFLIGLVSNAFSHSIADLTTETYYEPAGGYNDGVGYNENWRAGLGVYVRTGDLGNYGNPAVMRFFTESGFEYAKIIPIAPASGDGNLPGTWEVTDNSATGDYVHFFMVKDLTGFSLRKYDPAARYGTWNSGWVPDAGRSRTPADMSHVQEYFNAGTPVPEPAAMLLVGIGLVGLAATGRRKLFKK